ncbi:prepilin-type N-terminal cleavage/methylation domain-containing protein [Synechococcus sp. 8F6]|uniref:prepilin-type N-terminal cleavage/methylation domain-containing protein n=1 Tax=Synechococcus sp. 8F6 TaxID=2025606 RepID=UPI000B9826B9|nr:prepilin-type N-terminal cleavage/methylation domain-containing protein [Synechococcus sp. 8F6]
MRSCNSQGFTLVELMLVVVLMGLTSVLGLSSYYRFMNDARLNSGGKAIAGWLDQIRSMAIQNSKTCTVQINPASGTLELVTDPTLGNCDFQDPPRPFTFNLQEQVGQGEIVQLCARLMNPSAEFTPCSSSAPGSALTVRYTPRGTTPDNALIELRSAKQSHNRCIALHSPLGLIRLGRVLNDRCDWTSAW